MTVRENTNLLSTVQSSYLWTNDDEPLNNVVNVPTEDSNICNGLLQATSPRFHAITDRSSTTPSKNVPKKEATATSLSDMHLISSETAKSRTPWTPNITANDTSQTPMIETSSRSSRFALLAKNGHPVCQARVWIIALGALILALAAISIGIPLGLSFRLTTSAGTTTSTTTTTTSSSSTTSTTSTTTTPPATAWIPTNYYTSCSVTCTSVSTVTPSTLIASWTFEQNTNDVSGNGQHGQIVNGAAFTAGYIGQAIVLRNNDNQFVNVPYINLVSRSFTVEGWIQLYSLNPTGDLSIVGECETPVVDKCLHYLIRQNKLYLAFFHDDLSGTTSLTTSVWYHVAYVYDYSANVKSVYLNGLMDGISTGSASVPSISAYLGISGNFTIGTAGQSASKYWDGLIDQLTITNRVKTPCEILNDASLVAHFPFDNSYNDVGPNSMTGTRNSQGNNGLSWVSGQVNQALNFNSSNAYFQSCGFYALGKDQPYSIAMWVNPSFQSGTLFHISSAATGSGAWCLPMIGFSSNGSIVAQTWRGGTISIIGPILPVNTWTHIVQTYSSTNGLQLYINGGLYDTAPVTGFSASNLVMCVTLGSSGLGRNCQTGSISMGPYSGGIDELYVYNRELNNFEVCPLAHP